MASHISRRRLARYVADQLLAGSSDVLLYLAGYLIETGRTREVSLVVRDIEDQLAAKGVVVARVTSARKLSRELTHAIEKSIASQYADARVELGVRIDQSLLGGVQICTPDSELDSSLRSRLTNLKASKI